MIKSAPYYWLECDGDGCERTSTEDTDYAAWSERSDAVEQAENGDWLVTDRGDSGPGNGEEHFCPEHIPCTGAVNCPAFRHIEGCYES